MSGYIVWALGILLSLTAFGLNTTSLAVVFGALSIGLGFGLQNIFNNFISGLILLFERPIQVGDVVEVGGTWGEVLKINVRSTLVQTYDNSTLIIPNSEFISSRVTNWSHKDPTIRRDLMVGVAYGSDTALVEQLLLQAADGVKEVVQYPRNRWSSLSISVKVHWISGFVSGPLSMIFSRRNPASVRDRPAVQGTRCRDTFPAAGCAYHSSGIGINRSTGDRLKGEYKRTGGESNRTSAASEISTTSSPGLMRKRICRPFRSFTISAIRPWYRLSSKSPCFTLGTAISAGLCSRCYRKQPSLLLKLIRNRSPAVSRKSRRMWVPCICFPCFPEKSLSR